MLTLCHIHFGSVFDDLLSASERERTITKIYKRITDTMDYADLVWRGGRRKERIKTCVDTVVRDRTRKKNNTFSDSGNWEASLKESGWYTEHALLFLREEVLALWVCEGLQWSDIPTFDEMAWKEIQYNWQKRMRIYEDGNDLHVNETRLKLKSIAQISLGAVRGWQSCRRVGKIGIIVRYRNSEGREKHAMNRVLSSVRFHSFSYAIANAQPNRASPLLSCCSNPQDWTWNTQQSITTVSHFKGPLKKRHRHQRSPSRNCIVRTTILGDNDLTSIKRNT